MDAVPPLSQVLQPEFLGRMLLVLAVTGARPLGFILLMPVFGRFKLTAGYLRGAMLVAMILPVLPGALAIVATDPNQLTATALPGLILREMAVGVLLGILVGVPVWAVAAAGDIMDLQRGASMAQIIDPGSGMESSVTGTFLVLTLILVLAAEGVLIPALFGPLFDSYGIVPLFAPMPPVDAQLGVLMLRLMDQLLRAGLVLALPVLIPLLLIDVAVAVATKYMPQLNAMFLSMSIKQGIHALLLILYAATLGAYAAGLFGSPSLRPDMLRGFLPELAP